MLELKNITAGYGKKMVLSDVSVKLNDRERLVGLPQPKLLFQNFQV